MIRFLWGFFILIFVFSPSESQPRSGSVNIDKTILVYGNGMDKRFIQYVADLTEKKNPTICFVTTAAADNPQVIQYIEKLTSGLKIKVKFLVTFITSSPEQESFRDIIFSSDAIMVGGGNTLNMLGIWKAQGIDILLKQAYERGIILAGGSAGSLCWFNGGVTDSRPQELTLMECLGFLDYSHAPHYNNDTRREMYKEAVLKGKLTEGYACDDGAGLLFINGKMVKSLSLGRNYNNYFVSLKNGRIREEKLDSEILN